MPHRKKRKIAALSQPFQRQLALPHEGRFFDLRQIFDDINARYFGSTLTGFQILWGRRRKLKPIAYFVFGTIQEDDKIIRIHPLLDASFVPFWFVEYVVYHEMLHAVVPDETFASGRRKVHTVEFLRREKLFPHYRKARKWETENLCRFLR